VLHALDRVRMRATHASGDRPGNTRVRGRSDAHGTEIERHAPYAPGDDLRRIDWASYARLGELLIRRFVAEREVPVWVIVDASASMGPPEPGSKLDMATAIGAIFATVALSSGDRVFLGSVPGSAGQPLDRCGPLRQRRCLFDVQRFFIGLTPVAGAGDLVAGVASALRATRRGVVVLVSDFLYLPAEIERLLDLIVASRSEGKIVQVLSREDVDPSRLRNCDTLIDRETGSSWRIRTSADTWQRYERALAEHAAFVSAAAARRAMTAAATVSDTGLRSFLREEMPRLGLRLVR
jgi:hypothetical protein